jgi:hypothetical protein
MRLTIILLFLSLLARAQPVLKPSIGLGSIPDDNDSICNEPFYLGSFFTSGLQAGDTAYDFLLYDINGDSLHLADALSHSNPVLLVAGSYTCPVFRGKVDVINDVLNTYPGQVEVYIIYTLEAHPDSDTSVYFGYVNPTTQNIQQGVLYGQPKTYGERKQMISDMLSSMNISVPVFIDGPCNNWWNTFGPAPNNSYLIDTTGIVFSKHGWFDRYPDNIYCDIDSLLGTSSGNCNSQTGNSTYSFQYLSNDTVIGEAGVMISVDAELTNTGNDDILIHAQRIENDLPPGWETSMCIDVCYSTSTDSVVFILPASSTQQAHVYFYTSAGTPDTGHVKMGFKNLSVPTNNNFMHAFGVSEINTGIHGFETLSNGMMLSPNPATDFLKLNFANSENSVVEIYNMLGEKKIEKNLCDRIDISSLPAGMYILKCRGVVERFVKK